MSASLELSLYQSADAAWAGVIRPWLEAGKGLLGRRYVVVATRGQAHGLKQRCLVEGVTLLGVEFLTPGLARKKWRPLIEAERAAAGQANRPAIGRELLLLGLRRLIARRRAEAAESVGGDPLAGLWQSLESDPEQALDDFDALLQAGFSAADFEWPALRDIFGELTAWVEARGHELAARQTERAGLTAPPADQPPLADAVLVYGLSAEAWGEFFNVIALVRRCAAITVALPEPAWRGRAESDEQWVELWQSVLGVQALPIEPGDSGEAEGEEAGGATVNAGLAVAECWARPAEATALADEAVGVIVGRSRADEIALVVAEIRRLIEVGAENVAVVVPASPGLHRRVVRALAAAGVPFADMVGLDGAPPVDARIHRGLIRFFAGGAMVDDLAALWPWLRAVGVVTQSVGEAREGIEWSFARVQNHALAAHVAAWGERERFAVLRGVAEQLLPAWGEALTLAEAVARIDGICEAWEIEAPAGWGALRAFAEHETDPLPRAVVAQTLLSFLPEKHPASDAPGRGQFARVTVTTLRRAVGLAWSHVIWMGSNAGIWPRRDESSGWLTDAHRANLNARGRFSLGVLTSAERVALEKRAAQVLAADARDAVVFSAALHEDGEAEMTLAPNAWLERVLAVGSDAGGEAEFERLARVAVVSAPAGEGSSADRGDVAAWREIWRGRRDPTRPFDEYFLAGDPALVTPEHLSARRIESGLRDPAELWFEGVLGVRRVATEPLLRTRRKALGQRTHELLARVLAPADRSEDFGPLPDRAQAEMRLDQELRRVRSEWPADACGDSFHGELGHVLRRLVDQVYEMDGAGDVVAVERSLPAEAVLTLPGGRRLRVSGRMDLVRMDRAGWRGARVAVVDFKTGGDAALSAGRMARDGSALQLGIYLAALRGLGASGGDVRMLKPDTVAGPPLAMAELDEALALLAVLEAMLDRGIYGALTPDENAFSHGGFRWPLASTPVAQRVLLAKWAATFGNPEEDA